jgi:predicted deacylase
VPVVDIDRFTRRRTPIAGFTSTRSIDVGDGVALDVVDIDGLRPGPTLTVLGGVHGDELEGVVAARRLAAMLRAAVDGGADPAGRVRILAVSNPPAFGARLRSSPLDGANLARVFPGDPDGSISHRIASAITTELIEGSDLLVDLHSAGARYEMPVFVGYVTDTSTAARAKEAAYAFGAPLVWEHDGGHGEGRTMSAAEQQGVASVYVEGSGGGGLQWYDLEIYHHGLQRLIGWLGILPVPDDVPEAPEPLVVPGGHGDTDVGLACSHEGFCVARVASGDIVQAGQALADILDSHGRVAETVRAPSEGMVMMVRRQAEIDAGESVAMLGPIPVRGRPSS